MDYYEIVSILIVISAVFEYIIVVFSIIGQGLTVEGVIKKFTSTN
jgi:hypothetical protein